MSSRTRFPSRICDIPLNHNVRGTGSMTMQGNRGIEAGTQRFGGRTRIFAFELLMQSGGDLEEFAVARLPNLEEWPRVQAAFQRAALVEAFLKGLADEILFQAFAAGVFQNAHQPEEFLV